MTYREGNKVIYPRLGICRVAGVIEQSAGGTVVKCYSLKPLDSLDSTTILVPVSKKGNLASQRDNHPVSPRQHSRGKQQFISEDRCRFKSPIMIMIEQSLDA